MLIQLFLKVLQKYYDTENVAIGLELDLPGNEDAREALIRYSIDSAEDGISLLAREIATDTIVGSVTNKIQVKPNSPDEKTFSEIFKEKYCKNEKSQLYVQSIIDAANKYDVFTTYKTDCYVELMFLSTLPQYRQKSIASSLCLYTVKIADALKYGIGLDKLPENLRKYRPTCVVAMFASNYSSAIGRKLGFDFIDENSYEDAYFNGKKMSDRIGKLHKSWFMAVKKL
ncbi:uncharacterized protein LOC119069449 [Bradysia coprophila]|uniref:uncharacterized protein LOC119069449 n=1 Tax=Bradysia coprophila TaxID=38358 RepID=UPI00187DCB2C|nr:uncharacterized protein LOC119069449 [Bradysia coprophila]